MTVCRIEVLPKGTRASQADFLGTFLHTLHPNFRSSTIPGPPRPLNYPQLSQSFPNLKYFQDPHLGMQASEKWSIRMNVLAECCSVLVSALTDIGLVMIPMIWLLLLSKVLTPFSGNALL